MKKMLGYAMVPFLLAGCMPEMDMQGVNPVDHYKENPIENKVETKNETYNVQFIPGRSRLSADAVDSLQAALASIPPMAVESVQVQMHASDLRNEERKEHISKLLRRMGYERQAIMFEPSDSLKRDELRLDVSYASVVSPRCPDWRTSPVTTYSNTSQAGFSCASVTNLGLMVADPRDLERGAGVSSPDSERNSTVLESYRTNKGAGEDAAASAAVNTSIAP